MSSSRDKQKSEARNKNFEDKKTINPTLAKIKYPPR